MSSKTNIRLMELPETTFTASANDNPRASATLTTIMTKAVSMQSVWKVSVHTNVFIPPRLV